MKLLARTTAGLALSLAALGLMLGPACSKKDDEAKGTAPAAQEQAAAQKEGEGAAAKDRGEAAAKPAAEAPSAKVETPTKPAEVKAPTAETPKPSAAAGGGLTLPGGMTVPDSVVGLAGVPSLQALLDFATKVGNKVAPGQLPPNLSSMALEMAKTQLGLSDVSWLKQDAPIKIVVVDPKTYEGGGVVVVPITDKEKVLASLSPDAKKDVDGHAATMTVDFQTQYIDFIEGHAVITTHKDLFGKVKDFVGGDLSKWNPTKPFTLTLAMENVNRLFGKEIQEGKRMVGQMYEGLAQQTEFPGAGKVLQSEIDMLFALIESSARIDVELYGDAGQINLGFGFAAKAGSGLASFIGSLAGKSSSLTGAAPPTSWMGFAVNMDVRKVESLKSLQKAAIEMYVQALKLTPEETTKLSGMVDQLWQMSAGDQTFAIYTDGKFPLAMSALTKTTDAAKARALYKQALDMLFPKLWGFIKEQAAKDGTQLPEIEVKTLGDLVKFANDQGAPLGIKLALESATEGDLTVDSLVIDVDWEKTPLKAQDPEAFKLVNDIVGKRISMAIGFKGDQISMGFGPKGTETAKSLASGTLGSGEPTLNAAARGSAFAATIRLGAAMEAFSFVPDLAPKKPAIDSMPKDEAFTFQGKSQGGTLTFTLGVPTDLVMAFSKFD